MSDMQVPIPPLPDLAGDDLPVLVQAHSGDDPPGAVPLDQVPLYSLEGVASTCLFVPADYSGTLRLTLQTK